MGFFSELLSVIDDAVEIGNDLIGTPNRYDDSIVDVPQDDYYDSEDEEEIEEEEEEEEDDDNLDLFEKALVARELVNRGYTAEDLDWWKLLWEKIG